MDFHVGNGRPPASLINHTTRSSTTPEMSLWESAKGFFCLENQPEALECILKIFHPSAGTTRGDVANIFEQLRTLANFGCRENIQSGRHGENHFCILDENNREILSVTIEAGERYTVQCQEYTETHILTMDTERGNECATHAEGANGTPRISHASTTPQTAKDYEAVWFAWEKAAPPEEARDRATVVNILRDCQSRESTEINLNYLNISSLPGHFPQCIKSIKIENIKNIKLTSLPALPGSLETLLVNDTPLTSLPPLPATLTRLRMINTQLISLPESIAHITKSAIVTLHNNPLSERTLQRLQAIASDPGYKGPKIRFNMAGPSVPRETRALHLAVADWLTAAKQGETAPADRWQAFGQQNNAASFSDFLDILHHTDNCKKDPSFKTQISSWLAQLAEDNALREKTFAMAKEATSSCEDRVTLALNQMKTVQLLHNAEKGEFNEDLPGLVSVGREMFRLEKLEQIAWEKVKTLYFVDEIEVYLGYQNKLKRQLELTSVTAEMRFFGISYITPSDLEAAEMQVKTAENSEFSEWILQWEPVRSMLKHKEPARWEALCEKKISDYDDTYQSLKEGMVKNKLDGDIDAERTIGTEAMKRAEQAFLDGLRPLADEMLGRYLKARWPLTESVPSL